MRRGGKQEGTSLVNRIHWLSVRCRTLCSRNGILSIWTHQGMFWVLMSFGSSYIHVEFFLFFLPLQALLLECFNKCQNQIPLSGGEGNCINFSTLQQNLTSFPYDGAEWTPNWPEVKQFCINKSHQHHFGGQLYWWHQSGPKYLLEGSNAFRCCMARQGSGCALARTMVDQFLRRHAPKN